MFGQLSVSNPGAFFRRSSSASKIKRLFWVSTFRALHGTAKSFSPRLRKPPNTGPAGKQLKPTRQPKRKGRDPSRPFSFWPKFRLTVKFTARGKSSLFVARQLRPGINHGVWVQRDAADALIHEPFGQIGVIGRPLAADADVLASLVGGSDGHGEQHLDGRIALVKEVGDEAGVAVAERAGVRMRSEYRLWRMIDLVVVGASCVLPRGPAWAVISCRKTLPRSLPTIKHNVSQPRCQYESSDGKRMALR
jgi:hypothetical protein